MSNNAFSKGLTFVESGGFDAATSLLTAINASGAGSEGSWSEIIAATDCDADTLYVYISFLSGGGSVEDVLIDIGVGAASSETVVIENVPYSGRVASAGGTSDVLSFPIQIPSGSRISARANGDSSIVLGIGVTVYKGGEKSFAFSGAVGLGVTSSWGGTAVDSGAAANTKGSWTELVASTSTTIRGFWIHMGLLENLTVGVSTGDFIDIGIGAAASERTIVSNHYINVNTNEIAMPSTFFDIEIPSGTRIAARRQCSDTDATDRVRAIALVGII